MTLLLLLMLLLLMQLLQLRESILCSFPRRVLPDLLFSCQNKVRPGFLRARIFAHGLGQDFHPAFFLGRAVGVEINDLAVREPDSEPFLHEHVPFFFFREGALAASAFAGTFLLQERGPVVDQLRRFAEVDRRARLTRRFMVCGQLAPVQLEEAATPVLELKLVSTSSSDAWCEKDLLDNHHLAD